MMAHTYRSRLAVLVLAGLLGACTVGPDHASPTLQVAATWSSAQQQAGRIESLAEWWRRFDDPVLDALVAAATAANTDVAQAAAKLRQAREVAIQSGASRLPSLEGSASVSRSRSALGSLGGAAGGDRGAVTSSSYAAGFDASWEIDLFGGQRRDVERTIASAEASVADLADTLVSIQGEVASAYIDARAYQQRVAIARRTVALRQDSLSLARSRARGGTGAEIDAVQAQAELESARATIPPLEQGSRQAALRLAVLTSQTPAAMLDRLEQPRPPPRLSGGINPDPPLAALARRPDIRAAERRIAAATANIGVAEADRLPALTLAGSIGLNATTLSSATRGGTSVWSLGPSLSLPIFDAGRRASVVRERVAAREEAVAAWQGVVNGAVEEVEKALDALDRERAHEAALQRTVNAYADSVSLATTLYRAGMGDYSDVVTAQRSLASAQDALVQSQAQLSSNAVSLFKALGGGW
ncbi:efflux transporter outer membrane subunit [Roseomonas sp. F4]